MIRGALGVVIGGLWPYREIGAERLVDPEEGGWFYLFAFAAVFEAVSLATYAIGRGAVRAVTWWRDGSLHEPPHEL